MKIYTLEAVLKGETVKFAKAFDSRESAIDYLFHYYTKRYMNNDLVVNEEITLGGDKHNVEYVCDHNDRFRINRVIL